MSQPLLKSHRNNSDTVNVKKSSTDHTATSCFNTWNHQSNLTPTELNLKCCFTQPWWDYLGWTTTFLHFRKQINQNVKMLPIRKLVQRAKRKRKKQNRPCSHGSYKVLNIQNAGEPVKELNTATVNIAYMSSFVLKFCAFLESSVASNPITTFWITSKV